MRIIAGERKGMSLKAPKGERTRPTTDRVKESLFAVIGPVLPGKAVLDLFAGSGALAIEALSRGAARAVLVDRDPAAVACIRDNLSRARFTDRARLMACSALRAIAMLRAEPEQYDIVFLDPPYASGFLLPTMRALHESGLVREDGLIVAEHSRKEEIPAILENFSCMRRLTYGDTVVSLFRRHSSDSPPKET